MEKVTLAPGIYEYKNVFDNPKYLIDEIEKLFGSAYVSAGVHEKGNSDSGVNKKVRDVDTFALSDPDSKYYSKEQLELYKIIKDSMLSCLKDYQKDYEILDELKDFCWMVLRYGPEQMFNRHSDDGSAFPRTVSITAYLNDDYDGGELEYRHFNLSFKPSAGSVLVFPSNYVYQHRVVPVKSGLRYAVVNWFRWSTLPNSTLNGDNTGVVYKY